MPVRPRAAALSLLAAVLSAPLAAVAARAHPPQTLALDDATTLPLTACAARNVLFLDGYMVSLYLPDNGHPPHAAISAQVPKAVRIDVTWQGSLPGQLPGRWEQRLRKGVTPDVFSGIQDIYARLSRGDSVVFAHAPSRGTTVSVNGRRVLALRDASLVDTLLDMFVGPEPVSHNTKRLLLEPGC